MRSLTQRFAIGPRWLRLSLLVVLLLPVLAACTDDQGTQNNERATESREQIFSNAEAAVPAPVPVNFPLRQALADFTVRQDMLNHPFYVYIMGENGTYVGYFVGQTYPVNACNYLSSSQRVRGSSNGNLILTAPSLDGTFGGGGGASSACDVYFFFDVETDALVTFTAPMFFASDVPLEINVPRLGVAPGGVVPETAPVSTPIAPAG